MSQARRAGLTPAIAILAAIAMSGAIAFTQATVQPVNDAPNPYQAVEGWAKMPEGRTWGSTSAVDIDPDGKSIWVAERCGANSCAGSDLPVVLKFEASGTLVKSCGAGMFIFPHGIHVDKDGNVWVTDARAANPQELEKSPDAKAKGHTSQVQPRRPGADDARDWSGRDLPARSIAVRRRDRPTATSSSPTAMAVRTRTRRRRSRIVKYRRRKFIKRGSGSGGRSDAPRPGVDSRGRLFVADRGTFASGSIGGTFLEEWKQFSRLSDFHRQDRCSAGRLESMVNQAAGCIQAPDGKSRPSGPGRDAAPRHAEGGWDATARMGGSRPMLRKYVATFTRPPRSS